jgi:hypothetical protein
MSTVCRKSLYTLFVENWITWFEEEERERERENKERGRSRRDLFQKTFKLH